MHKDRINFTKNINCNISLEEIIKGYFDETMAIYDLIATYDNFSINSNVDDTTIYFNLIFDNKEDAFKLKKILNNRIITKYNRNFTCIVELKDNILCVNVN